MDVKILANFGYHKGYSGTGLLYIGKATSGVYMCAIKFLENQVERWVYYRKSMVEAGYSGGDIVIASDFNLALLTDAVTPDFVTDSQDVFKTITTVVNGASLPRLYNLEQPYTVKGDGVTTAEIDAVRLSTSGSTPPPASGSGSGSGTPPADDKKGLGGIIPESFDLLFTNPLQFIQDNPLFVAAVIGVIYFIRRKKKKPLWIF